VRLPGCLPACLAAFYICCGGLLLCAAGTCLCAAGEGVLQLARPGCPAAGLHGCRCSAAAAGSSCLCRSPDPLGRFFSYAVCGHPCCAALQGGRSRRQAGGRRRAAGDARAPPAQLGLRDGGAAGQPEAGPAQVPHGAGGGAGGAHSGSTAWRAARRLLWRARPAAALLLPAGLRSRGQGAASLWPTCDAASKAGLLSLAPPPAQSPPLPH
jgi:hypothetical protein